MKVKKRGKKEEEPTEEVGTAPSRKVGDEAEIEGDDLELARQLAEAERLVEELTDQLLRSRAELDNTVKRAAREREASTLFASERLMTKLLPVLDSLDQAAKHVEGMDKVRKQLLDVLRTEGLSPIEAKGEKFDPYKHEALMMVESDEDEEGTVTEEVQRGYALNSKVIRFSKVLVSKKR
ncbi:nucleotide exchange factor GrpE [Methanothrix harundinacea]|jgi:molecular chaperone GrpE|uniref:Protein GrpE n=1 Tax=Methanothrix harundinacea (strain 6Ac) TaxID=1110509 RepID=G7WQC9_METH6|nr:Co-chaperone GrpE [Methanothrix harundinacea 6Ac]